MIADDIPGPYSGIYIVDEQQSNANNVILTF